MAVMPRASSREEYEKWFKAADKNNDGSLTAKEVKKMFKSKGYKIKGKVFKQQFASLDADGDKKVTLDEYLKAMGEIGEETHKSMCADDSDSFSDSDDEVTTHIGSTTAVGPETFQAWFRAADKNNDGVLTAKELKKMFKSKGYKTSSKAFKQEFASLDTDGDKKISLQEYMVAMGQIPDIEHKDALDTSKGEPCTKEDFEKWFKDADKNNDGFLTSKELKKMFKSRGVKMGSKAFKKHFASLDTDGDKKVSYKEYLNAMGQIQAEVGADGIRDKPDHLAAFRPDGVAPPVGTGASAAEDLLAAFRPSGAAAPATTASTAADPLAAFRPEGAAPPVQVAPPSAQVAPPSAQVAPPPSQVAPPQVQVAPPQVQVAPLLTEAKTASGSSDSESDEEQTRKVIPHPTARPVEVIEQAICRDAQPEPLETSHKAPEPEPLEPLHKPIEPEHADLVTPICKAAAAAPDPQVVAPKVAELLQSSDSSDSETEQAAKVSDPVSAPVPQPRTSDHSSPDSTPPKDQPVEVAQFLNPVREAEIRAQFQAADRNGDGHLDLDEMKALLTEMRTGLTNKQMFDIMHKADVDGSGMINYNEFIVLWLKEHGVLTD